MKDIIISTLDKFNADCDNNAPTTMLEKKSISIMDIDPWELADFMRKKNIPKDVEFDGRDNGYDAWDDILLSWNVIVPASESYKIGIKKSRFKNAAHQTVCNALKESGYINYSSLISIKEYKKFKRTSIYKMYVNKEFNQLVEYFSIYYKSAE